MIYSMHVTRIRQNTRPHKYFIMTVHPAYATKEIESRNRIHCWALLFQEIVTRNDYKSFDGIKKLFECINIYHMLDWIAYYNT